MRQVHRRISIEGVISLAGQPGKQAVIKFLGDYGLDKILERIVDGETLRSIATDLSVTRPQLSQYLSGVYHGSDPEIQLAANERRVLYDTARKLSAMSLAEDGRGDLDDEADPRNAQLANYRAQYKLRLASHFDKERFGDPKNKIEVTIAVQHLDSLRKRTIVKAVIDDPNPRVLGDGDPDYEIMEAE